jgi:predicted acylesterase/phospholipase RssA
VIAYSPERRTALVLSGTGAHGAYHAGVLRAFHEAGVKIDVVAGHGIGAAAAALTAIDGASTLWEAKGLWQGEKAAGLYVWPRPWRFVRWLAAVFGIGALIPARDRRQPRARWREAMLGTPLETTGVQTLFADTIWQLVRGAATTRPAQKEIGRRYGEVLTESLGQPGVRELVMVATDIDARHDITAALLREPYRKMFLSLARGDPPDLRPAWTGREAARGVGGRRRGAGDRGERRPRTNDPA